MIEPKIQRLKVEMEVEVKVKVKEKLLYILQNFEKKKHHRMLALYRHYPSAY